MNRHSSKPAKTLGSGPAPVSDRGQQDRRAGRRTFLGVTAATLLPSVPLMFPAQVQSATLPMVSSPVGPDPSSDEKKQFLDDLQCRCYQFFVEAAHPETGLVADRARTDGTWFSGHASSAACGFSLVADVVAANASWHDRQAAESRTERLLDTMLNRVEHQHGFFYHFMAAHTGQRSFPSEISSIDTAIFIAGAMVSAAAFSSNERIVDLANQLCDRVDWKWMLNGSDQFSMGWTPEHGFLSCRWDRFSELTLLLLIGMGSRTNSVPGECWNAWRRDDLLQHNGRTFLSYPPLFVHQYPQAFFDFRKYVSPSGRSYWENSVTAHQAQIEYLSKLAQDDPQTFGHYGAELWGLTSSDSVDGYRDWGGPYRADSIAPERGMDGSIVPSAAAGGLPILPVESMQTLMAQNARFGDQIYGRYGFVNAYNPRTGWVGSDVIGIDTGISLIMAENFRSGRVWEYFMQHENAQRGLEVAGFERV